MEENTVKIGDYVIVQRQNYTKLNKMKDHGTLPLGKDIIELDNVLGEKYYQTFRMVLKPGSSRLYALEKVDELITKNQLSIEQSGADNRNIIDDGNSQVLTKSQIEELRDQAVSSSVIVEKLIANSNTFGAKTEYSQEKYLKKKEKKYFEYIQIRKPTIRLLAQLFYRLDPSKTLGVRIDDLSQILTYANVKSDGDFLLYDSGTSGLLTAAIVNAIGPDTNGHLIYAHPGNECQKNIFVAMQFPREQYKRCIHVNLYSVLRSYYQEDDKTIEDQVKDEDTVENEEKTNECQEGDENCATEQNKKRKLSTTDAIKKRLKKPCWQVENEEACRILRNKVDSIIVVAKEHPVNIVKELVPFLKAGRTLVVFNLLREPLQDLYFYLKTRTDFIGIKLSNNVMRNYQVLPERTHPEVTMNSGGYILSGYKIKF